MGYDRRANSRSSCYAFELVSKGFFVLVRLARLDRVEFVPYRRGKEQGRAVSIET